MCSVVHMKSEYCGRHLLLDIEQAKCHPLRVEKCLNLVVLTFCVFNLFLKIDYSYITTSNHKNVIMAEKKNSNDKMNNELVIWKRTKISSNIALSLWLVEIKMIWSKNKKTNNQQNLIMV